MRLNLYTTHKMPKGRPSKKILPISVVYRKSESSKKYYMQVFENMEIDQFLTTRRFKNVFPESYVIEEIGVGEGLIEDYMKQFNIKSLTK